MKNTAEMTSYLCYFNAIEKPPFKLHLRRRISVFGSLNQHWFSHTHWQLLTHRDERISAPISTVQLQQRVPPCCVCMCVSTLLNLQLIRLSLRVSLSVEIIGIYVEYLCNLTHSSVDRGEIVDWKRHSEHILMNKWDYNVLDTMEVCQEGSRLVKWT